MRTIGILITVLVISLMTIQTLEPGEDRMQATELDPAFRTIVPPDAKLQTIVTGLKWTEGPVWIKTGYLLFADIPSNSIRKWSPSGETTIALQPSGFTGQNFGGAEPGSNGMTLDTEGRLTVAGHARRNVWRLETPDPHGPVTVLADRFEGKRLNSPNDLVYRSDGSLYFTDPPYGLETQSDNDKAKELSFNGVYRLANARDQKPGAAPDASRLTAVIRNLDRPNGLAFSPDEKYLYVGNSDPKKRIWMRYRVKDDGGVEDPKLVFDATTDERKGNPDGMKVDVKGNLYCTGPGGIWIFSGEGKQLGLLHIPELTANLAWGDEDGKTLFITASTSLYKVRLNIPGIRP